MRRPRDRLVLRARHRLPAQSGRGHPRALPGRSSGCHPPSTRPARSDVSSKLQALIDDAPDGATISFQAGGRYKLGTGRCASAAGATSRSRATGPGSTCPARSTPATASIGIQVRSGSVGTTIRGLTMVGNNTTAGTSDACCSREAQHAIAVLSANDTLIEDVDIRRTWGDCVYVNAATVPGGAWSDGVTFRDSTCSLSGRHGVGIIRAKDVRIVNNRFDQIGFMVVDIEPGAADAGADGVVFRGNDVGTYGLTDYDNSWLLAACGKDGADVRNVTVRDNTVEGNRIGWSGNVTRPWRALSLWVCGDNAPRANFVVTDNVAQNAVSGPAMVFTGVKGLTVTGNRAAAHLGQARFDLGLDRRDLRRLNQATRMGLREEPLISQHAANAASVRAPLAYRSTRRRAGRLRDRVGRNEARATVVGVSAGAFIVAAVTSGSTLLMLLASGVAISVSVISPLAGLIALALAAPLARTLVIPAPGLYVAMAGAMFLGLVLRLPLQRSQPRLPSAAVVLLGAFLFYAGVHLVAGRLDGAPGLRTTELASLFARVTECVLAFGLASVILRGRTPYPVLGALLASAVIAGFLGLAQLTGMDASFSDLMEPPGESGRITSVFSNPNYYGAYLASMTVLAVALLSVVASRRARTALLVAAAFLFLVLLFTQSRGGLATLLAGLMAIAFVHSRRAGFLAAAGLAFGALLAYPVFSAWRFEDVDPGVAGNVVTAGGRIDAWASGFESFVSSPVFGIGLGRFQDASGGITAHNWYVQVLAELGLAGIVIWGLFILAATFALKDRSLPARVVGYSMLVAFMVASMSMSPLTNFRLAGPILISIAAATVARWLPEPGERDGFDRLWPRSPAPSSVELAPLRRASSRREPH